MAKRDDDEYEFAYIPDLYHHPLPVGHIRRFIIRAVLQALIALADAWDAATAPPKSRRNAD